MLKKIILSIIFIIVFLPNLALATIALPKQSLVPGGVALIEFNVNYQSDLPKVFFQGNRVLVVEKTNSQPSTYIAIVGIPVTSKPGTKTIKIYANNKILEKHFTVKSKDYPKSVITIKDKSKVTPSSVQLRRIERENKEFDSVLSKWFDNNVRSAKLTKPVEGFYTTRFGARRVMNGIAKAPHTGLDIGANKGTPVYAAANGKVVLVGDYFFSGNFVFVDHGQNFSTIYCHLNQIDVKIGDFVKQGTQLGTVGKTGRVTGAHLHFGVRLNKVRVDPELFFN